MSVKKSRLGDKWLKIVVSVLGVGKIRQDQDRTRDAEAIVCCTSRGLHVSEVEAALWPAGPDGSNSGRPKNMSMYHTFRAAPSPSFAGTEKRISTSTACLECRRKKTRCGGGQPCQQCTSVDRAEMCKYAKKGRRTMASRR
jgi:hypothetical protein